VKGSYKSDRCSFEGHGAVWGSHGLEVWANIKPSGDGIGTLVQIKARCELKYCQPSLVNNMTELKLKALIETI